MNARWPGEVPDGADGLGAVVDGGLDTDRDGRADTALTADGDDLLVLSDLDGDGLADRVLRIGPDAEVHAVGPTHPGFAVHPASDPVACDPDGRHHDRDHATGRAPAHGLWAALVGHLFGG
jgi:hypothetical protein